MFHLITKERLLGNKNLIVLGAAIIVFFVVCAGFYLSLPPKFNSPDETANYFFSKLYAEDGSIKIFEPLNNIAQNRIHPRSTIVIGGNILPIGFWGLILIYGWLAKIFGIRIIFCLTPFFASLAVVCFYKIIEKIFDEKIALWTALLLLASPPLIYYSARGLFPNILFVACLIISFYFLIVQPFKNSREFLNFVLVGIFLGLSLSVRTSEVIWVGAMILALFLFYRKEVKWHHIFIFLASAIVTFSPVFLYNYLAYGSPFSTGYNFYEAASDGAIAQAAEHGLLSSVVNFILPFGFHAKNILKNFSNYFAGMFWWLLMPLVIGFSILIRKLIGNRLDKEQKIYLFLYFSISLFLFIYYGSWMFSDNSTGQVSLGTAYTRYWLPIYIMSCPIIVVAWRWLLNFFEGKSKKIMLGVVALGCLLLSVKAVFFDPVDGLARVRENIKGYAAVEQEVSSLIEKDAVIIVDRADKIFFPEYRVIQPLRDDSTYNLIPALAKAVPLYYYGITLPQKDIDYLFKNKIGPRKIFMNKIRDFGDETLYKFEMKDL